MDEYELKKIVKEVLDAQDECVSGVKGLLLEATEAERIEKESDDLKKSLNRLRDEIYILESSTDYKLVALKLKKFVDDYDNIKSFCTLNGIECPPFPEADDIIRFYNKINSLT